MNDQTPRRAIADDAPQIEPLGLASLEELEENRQRANALDFDIKAIWSAVYRNRWVILVIIALSVVLGMVSAMLQTPIYRASASVQIDQNVAKVLESEQNDPTQALPDAERFLQTQLDVLRSRSQAVKVADDLGLARNNQFLVAMGEPPSSGTIGGLNAVASRRERVIRVLQHHMTVELPRNSRVATINFDSPDPALAASVANAYVKTFITANLQRRFDTSAYSREFLSNQIAEGKERLEQSERAMIAYARGAGLIDTSGAAAKGAVGGQSQTSLTMSNLVGINQSYNEARAARISAQQRWEQVQRTPLMNIPEVMGDPVVQKLRADRASAAVELQQTLERYGSNHPTVIQLRARVAELDAQIGRQASAIRNTIREAYQLAAKQEAALSGSVSQLTKDTLAEQDRGVQLNILKREVDTNRTNYEALLARFKDVSAAAGITTNNVSVIDVAERPVAPISPNMRMNMLLGGLGGFAFALIVVFMRERLDDMIRSPEDIDRKLGLPYLNAIPIVEAGTTPEEALENQRSHFSEAYFALRTAIELASPAGLPDSIFFTSAAPAEGKSTTALAVARTFAQVGRRTVLIDADLRKPTLHRELGLSNDCGLSNVLARQRSLADAIQASGIPNLDAITSGKLPPNPAELVSGTAIAELVAALEGRYDVVLIDGPPVLGLADAPAISSIVDATVFVIEANRSSRGKTKAAVRRLLSARARIIGAVLTKFDAKRIGYGSDYGYYYYYYGGQGPQGPGSARPGRVRQNNG
ncbi:polysaccharide biosynthesis tyrosine autokinase [Sphingomonas sp. LB-2]|uniref:GumC family protein n=1 Tax=Sphingomonas caeni TaxID=2984949 RepID=UPI0022305317|nr:polysaccharide biosynthesis tyrosine autokinase [Sphingomonas caeni]MCW3848502.1 polysaccharide biosynthesis tyrosine autokinase [Sphingomonas caeni]